MIWLGTKCSSTSLKQTTKRLLAFGLSAFTIGEFGNLTKIRFHVLLMVREAVLQSHVFFLLYSEVTFCVEIHKIYILVNKHDQ